MSIQIFHDLDDDGITAIVRVPLINVDKEAVLFQSDFNRLVEMGMSPLWKLSYGRVVFKGRAIIPVARFVANAATGMKVLYQDKDPTNLRRSNLIVALGTGKSRATDSLTPANLPTTIFKGKVEMTHKFNNPSHMTQG